jgi:hypothetical protein
MVRQENPRAVIVVPTIREQCIVDFLEAWRDEFRGAKVIVVEDNAERSFDIRGPNIDHYCHADIERDLGAAAWIIPRKTDCVRSYGYLKASKLEPDLIVTLDDDCLPLEPGFLATHWRRLNESVKSPAWVSTLDGITPRGVPYFETQRQLPCVLNHGLWESLPDFDAPTQLLQARTSQQATWTDRTIPVGSYFPMCGMNLAFRPEVVPALYFLLMGSGYEYDRFGDIWAGVIFKKIADHLGFSVNSGSPAVKHVRASNLWANLRKEAPGLEANEAFWARVDAVRLSGQSFGACHREIATKLQMPGAYFEKLSRAMLTWGELCDG